MSYRDDLEAAHQRIAALEHENAQLKTGCLVIRPGCTSAYHFLAKLAGTFIAVTLLLTLRQIFIEMFGVCP